jgi:hypothetical protein
MNDMRPIGADKDGNGIWTDGEHQRNSGEPLSEEEAIEALRGAATACTLLQRAADSLQNYCAEADGDINDPLAMEIFEFLGRKD